jgi:hypothetical protein
LIYLLQHGLLDSQQTAIVQSLLDTKQSSNFEEELQYAIEEIENNSSVGLHILIEMFSTFSTMKDQFYYFSNQLGGFMKSLSAKRSVDIYSMTIRFLDILLPPTRYVVKIDDENFDYQLSHLKLFPLYEDVFYTSVDLLKILSKADKFVHENCVKILYKLWNLYPRLRSQLNEMILSNFKAINSSAAYDPKRKASEFLYLIMHDKEVEGDFKGQLEDEGLESLFEDDCYDKAIPAPIELKDLKISAGFPICSEVKPGEKSAYYVEVKEKNSILSWGFATEDYDISYTISRMNPFEEILFQGERVACDTTPIISAILVQSPGLYKFEWNNNFSWFRSKKIRYRISILTPILSSPETFLTPRIQLLNQDEIGDLCFVLPNSDFTEIGISINSSEISCFSSVLDKIPLNNENPDEKINRILASVSGKCKKIGIVEKEVKNRNFDLNLGAFAVCRDVEAFALLNHDSMQVFTLVAVIEDDGVRSAVVNAGRLLPNGDVSNLKGMEASSAVALLLSLFGPATVVVIGADIEKLVARARLMVPGNIWNNSSVVFSDFSLAECASKLHYLLFRYKSMVY